MKVNSRYVDFRGDNHKLVGGSVDLRILEREEILRDCHQVLPSVSHMSVGDFVSVHKGVEKRGRGFVTQRFAATQFVADSLLFCTAV